MLGHVLLLLSYVILVLHLALPLLQVLLAFFLLIFVVRLLWLGAVLFVVLLLL